MWHTWDFELNTCLQITKETVFLYTGTLELISYTRAKYLRMWCRSYKKLHPPDLENTCRELYSIILSVDHTFELVIRCGIGVLPYVASRFACASPAGVRTDISDYRFRLTPAYRRPTRNWKMAYYTSCVHTIPPIRSRSQRQCQWITQIRGNMAVSG